VGNRLIRPTRLAVVMLGAVEIAASPARAQGWNPAPASGGVVAPASASPRPPTRVRAVNVGLLEMSVRRLSDSVEVVIGGVGPGPQLMQTTQGSTWQGSLLVATPTTLRRGPQRLSLPEAGLQSISIDGAGSRYSLLVTPVAGYPLGRPVVSADGTNLILSFAAAPQVSQTTYGRDLALPGRVPQPDFLPSLQPRAVAPPVGDMAVGSIMIANTGFVNVSGPPVSMTLSNAPIQQVLMLLAKLGGYGLVFVNDQAGSSSQSTGGGTPQAAASTASMAPQNRRISIAFRDESYGRAVNSSLMAAGLQGKIEGNTLLVGPNVLGKGFGAQLSKVYRLNQVGANSAADYLANLGARVSKTNTTTTAISQGVPQSQQVSQASTTNTTQSSTTTTVDSYGSDSGPLLGLQATTDSRLSTITLVGSPALVAVAETYLRQLDLRQRQVALSVKILDVTLDNDKSIDNSFAFRFGNNFIVNNQGQMLANFGSYQPPSTPDAGLPGTYSATGRTTPLVGTGALTSGDGGFIDQLSGTPYPGVTSDIFKRPSFGQFNNPLQPGTSGFTPGTPSTPDRIVYDPATGVPRLIEGRQGTSDTYTRSSPANFAYPKNQLFDFVKAVIESSSTKVLASPTLILSENSEELRTGDDQLAVNTQSLSSGGTGGSSSGGGAGLATIGRTKANESFVTVGEQVITNYTVTSGTQGNGNSCQPQFGVAGLTFGARISKIDDNGFVTFSMSPSISATVRQFPVQGCGPIDILAIRRLDTGSARVRDGQTLILTGVISDRDTEVVTKWPILGDVPIIGQFFRSSGSNRAKRELVIMVTPRIIDDTQGGTWGYGYQPSTRDTRRFLGNINGQSPY
jgi:type IV pilus assembly protein PilQ